MEWVYHDLFAVLPEVRPDAQAFPVPTKDDAALSIRACFVYFTATNGMRPERQERGPYATTRLWKLHGREVVP